MKIRLNIQQKIQFFILSATMLIYILAIGILSYQAKNSSYEDAIVLANKSVSEAAKEIAGNFNANLNISRTLSQSFLVYEDFEKDEWQALIDKMYKDVFAANPQIYAIWDSWELYAVDTSWTKSYGRIANTIWLEGGIIKTSKELRSLDGDNPLYAVTKSTYIPSINEPYLDVTNAIKEKKLMTSLNAPIMKNGSYTGVVSVDITLDQVQDLVEKIKPFEGSYAYLISNQGIISGHPNDEYLNVNICDVYEDDCKNNDIIEKIADGDEFNYIAKDESGRKIYYSYAPVIVGETGTPWSLAIAVPLRTIMAKAYKQLVYAIVIGVLGVLAMAVLIFFIGKSISNPISRVTRMLKQLAEGHIDKNLQIKIDTGDEISEMAKALNTSIDGLISKQEFAEHIGKNELNAEIDLLSEKDTLGKSLMEMRDNLKKANLEEEARKKEDEKRKWANEGLAMFGDILRQDNDDLAKLSRSIIQNLVNYLDANQGGVFILNEEDNENKYFELLAAYAFSRQKFINKQIHYGEGLVGVCAQEKQTIHITEIPQNYIEITSGLGGSTPKALLIVPLKLEDNILGVLEIASFKNFEKNEIEFVEKVAESIASTLNSVRINIKTSELLERSQQQSEEMAAQEEEMRQNLEELQATQEESSRKSVEMEGLIEALNKSSFVIEYNLDGYITEINDMYLGILDISREEVLGTHHSANMELSPEQKRTYDSFWNDLRNGMVKKQTSEITIKGKHFKFAETYSPIRDANGDIIKILKISNNITQE